MPCPQQPPYLLSASMDVTTLDISTNGPKYCNLCLTYTMSQRLMHSIGLYSSLFVNRCYCVTISQCVSAYEHVGCFHSQL